MKSELQGDRDFVKSGESQCRGGGTHDTRDSGAAPPRQRLQMEFDVDMIPKDGLEEFISEQCQKSGVRQASVIPADPDRPVLPTSSTTCTVPSNPSSADVSDRQTLAVTASSRQTAITGQQWEGVGMGLGGTTPWG